MAKRYISFLVALLLCVTSGCDSKNTNNTNGSTSSSGEVAKKTEEIETTAKKTSEDQQQSGSVAVDMFAGANVNIAIMKEARCQLDDFSKKPAFKSASDATGINVSWTYIDNASVDEKLSVILASGKDKMPDAFIGLLGEAKIANNAELFYDLSKDNLLDTYAPNIVKDYAKLADGLNTVKWPDGSIRALLTGLETERKADVCGIMFINKTWLDKLNLGIPTNAEEFYTVLKGFKDNDMNENGKNDDEIPLAFSDKVWCAAIMNLANIFGIGGYNTSNQSAFLRVRNGKVEPTADTDEFRAFLEYYNRLAKEGLLDVEGFSQTAEQYIAKCKEGSVGVFLAYTPRSYLTKEESSQYVVLPPFSALEGVKPIKAGQRRAPAYNKFGFAISATTQNVEALLTWWNYLSESKEMKWTLRQGEKGGTWDVQDGKIITSTPQGLTEDFTFEDYKYTNGIVNSGTLIMEDENAVDVDKTLDNESYYREMLADQVWDYLGEEYLPNIISGQTANEERTFIEIELVPYINNFVATSIVEGVTDSSWNTYKDGLNNVNYYEWIDWYQRLCDGTLE